MAKALPSLLLVLFLVGCGAPEPVETTDPGQPCELADAGVTSFACSSDRTKLVWCAPESDGGYAWRVHLDCPNDRGGKVCGPYEQTGWWCVDAGEP